MRARGVVEEKPACWVCANPQRRGWTLRYDLRGGTRNGRKQPLQPFFTSNEFQLPRRVIANEFIMAFGDAQRLVDRSDKFASDDCAANDGVEGLTQRRVQHMRLIQEYVGTVWVNLRQRKQLGAAFRGNDAGSEKEAKKTLPGEARRRAKLVYEFKRQAATDKVRWIAGGRHTNRLDKTERSVLSVSLS